MYIAFEGIDTVGKSTQIERLAKIFPDAIVTKEPGGTPLGKKIRKIVLKEGGIRPRSEILLFLADRAEHTESLIRPNLDEMILSDRSFISGIAYAHVHEKIEIEKLLELNRFATDSIFPDRIVLFTIDEITLKSRLDSKTSDVIEDRGINYMMKVQQVMINIVESLGINHIKIDAKLPMDEITQKIINFIRE